LLPAADGCCIAVVSHAWEPVHVRHAEGRVYPAPNPSHGPAYQESRGADRQGPDSGTRARMGRHGLPWAHPAPDSSGRYLVLRLRTKTVRIGTIPTVRLAAARTAALEVKRQLQAGCDPTFGLRVFGHALAQTGQLDIAAERLGPRLSRSPRTRSVCATGPGWDGTCSTRSSRKRKKSSIRGTSPNTRTICGIQPSTASPGCQSPSSPSNTWSRSAKI
jgi:hypothetical protein